MPLAIFGEQELTCLGLLPPTPKWPELLQKSPYRPKFFEPFTAFFSQKGSVSSLRRLDPPCTLVFDVNGAQFLWTHHRTEGARGLFISHEGLSRQSCCRFNRLLEVPLKEIIIWLIYSPPASHSHSPDRSFNEKDFMSLIRAQRASLIVLNSKVHQGKRVLSRIKQHFRRYHFEVRLFALRSREGRNRRGWNGTGSIVNKRCKWKLRQARFNNWYCL